MAHPPTILNIQPLLTTVTAKEIAMGGVFMSNGKLFVRQDEDHGTDSICAIHVGYGCTMIISGKTVVEPVHSIDLHFK